MPIGNSQLNSKSNENKLILSKRGTIVFLLDHFYRIKFL